MPEIYTGDASSAKVAISSIPNSWYLTVNGDGEFLIKDCDQDGRVVVKNMRAGLVDMTGWTSQSVDPDTGEVFYEFDFGDQSLRPGEGIAVFYGNMMWAPRTTTSIGRRTWCWLQAVER